MKRTLILILIILSLYTINTSADDIWEPEPAEISNETVAELFSWGDDIEHVQRFLRDYDFFFTDVSRSEDESNQLIIYSGENKNEQFSYTFLFTKDSGKLCEIRTNTVYIAGESAVDQLESLYKTLRMDEMDPYSDAELTAHAQKDFDGFYITADERTIYYGAYDCCNFRERGEKLCFRFIDRAFYESRTR